MGELEKRLEGLLDDVALSGRRTIVRDLPQTGEIFSEFGG